LPVEGEEVDALPLPFPEALPELEFPALPELEFPEGFDVVLELELAALFPPELPLPLPPALPLALGFAAIADPATNIETAKTAPVRLSFFLKSFSMFLILTFSV
jgi:hypothetical protein